MKNFLVLLALITTSTLSIAGPVKELDAADKEKPVINVNVYVHSDNPVPVNINVHVYNCLDYVEEIGGVDAYVPLELEDQHITRNCFPEEFDDLIVDYGVDEVDLNYVSTGSHFEAF